MRKGSSKKKMMPDRASLETTHKTKGGRPKGFRKGRRG
jgi:hypothetical protein